MSALGPQKTFTANYQSLSTFLDKQRKRTATLKSYEGFSLTKQILWKRCIFSGLSYGKQS